MDKNLIIVIDSFFDYEKNKVKIGGLQTYIRDLSTLLTEKGFNVTVYEFSDQKASCETQHNDVKIKRIESHDNQSSFNKIVQQYPNTFLYIISTDQMNIKSNLPNVITIQHGIAFDIPGNMIQGFWGKSPYFQLINKILRCVKNVKRLYRTKNTVCVDYNYFNWFRTLGTIYPDNSVTVIPNYSSTVINKDELDQKMQTLTTKGAKSIVFARRFFDYRGSILFAKVIKRLFDNGYNFKVTLAGNGPCEEEMRNILRNVPDVTFTSFNSEDSIEFHKDFDIAVVPTIFSEGTSLSLLEGMSAGCLPIATHVGGMTNIIIDGFNGFLAYPSEDSVYEKIKYALQIPTESFIEIVRNAYQTVSNGFSKNLWNHKWMELISKITKDKTLVY